MVSNSSSDRGLYTQVGGGGDGVTGLNSKTPLSSSTKSNELRGRRSWRAPYTILASLSLGLGISLAHHFMNAHLDGKAVNEISMSQSWVSRFGTALAFLAKMCFTISVGAAFIQHQWMRFHRQGLRIQDVDALTSVLGNFFSFFSSTVWFRQPVLTLIGLISWAIPFAAVITPGSLSVQPVHSVNTTSLQVPQPLYNATNYGYMQAGGGGYALTTDPRLYRLAFNTASAAQPIQLRSAFPNETYHVQFDGPAVRCIPANDSIVYNLTYYHGDTLNAGSSGNRDKYLAWVPGNEEALNSSYVEQFDTLDQTSVDTARIFIMTNLGFWNVTRLTQQLDYATTLTNGSDSTYVEQRQVNVTECQLHNATYEIDFRFQYPEQTQNVSISQWLNPVAAAGFYNPVGSTADNATAATIISYSAMMDAFGRMLAGSSSESHYSIERPLYTSYGIMSVDWADGTAVQRGLEQLFQNFTLSLLSDSGLVKNASQADNLPVQVTSYPITYVYDAEALLLAYGIAFVCSVACCAVGLYAFFVNHASYQNLFSTFVRATNDAELRSLISSNDDGADPLPKSLSRAEISMMDGSRAG